jgi:hypothetical protein
MFRHPARKHLGYGAFDAALTFHVLPSGDVWAFTNMDKSMATVVYSAKLGRQVTSDDGFPLVQGGRITQLQGDTVSSEKTIEVAADKAKAQIAPPAPKVETTVAAPTSFVPADATMVSAAPPATAASAGLHPYIVGAAAAVGLLFLGSKLLPRGA